MKIFSWNVNGIRAVVTKGFVEIIQQESPDIICLQETKAFRSQLPETVSSLPYHVVWHDGIRPGYAGTAIFSKDEPETSRTVFPDFPRFHEDGRVTEITFGKYILLNVYFPNGGTRANGDEMLSYKLAFYDDLTRYIQSRKQEGKQLIIVGDFNIAHTEIDIARPKDNENSIGFLPIERERLSQFIKENELVDIFRYSNPEVRDNYTWWTYRQFARERNVGWRIDYAMISKSSFDSVLNITHRQDIFGSDHCPVVLEVQSI